MGGSFITMDSPEFPYQKVQNIGSGGFGSVFLYEHKETKKYRAIKVINLPGGADKAAPSKYIESELQIMKRLKQEKHPHLVKLFEVLPVGERKLALILEYCDKGDLAQKLLEQRKKGRPMLERDAKKLFQDLALGLQHLWGNGIVHRDLKPANLLLKQKGTELVLKIADFGLAKELAEGQNVMKTILGTPVYAAPEVGYSQGYSSVSDLWSAGAILYEMLCGKKARQTPLNLQKKSAKNVPREGDIKFPPNQRKVLIDLYGGAIDFVERLLKARPEQRMTWEEFFRHPWLDLKSRTHFDFDEDNWGSEEQPYDIPLCDPIATGKLGMVWKAKERATQRTVALKMINKDPNQPWASEQEIMERMVNHKHSNIVKVYRTHKGRKNLYFVMEFCDQGDLSKYIEKNGPLGEELTKSLMQDLAKALQFIRSHNIVHRDLKPANFLLKKARNGRLRLKLADFGASIQVEDYSQPLQTFCGTPYYFAPESLPQSTEQKSSLSDLWSAGVAMHQMLFNRYPYEFNNEVEDIFKKIESEAIELRDGEEFSAGCMDLLRRLLKKNPKERISWAQFFAHPWLGLPRKTNPVTESLQRASHLIELSKRCHKDVASFSLHMEALSVLEQILPKKEGEEGSDISKSGDFSSPHGLRQPKTNPFVKSDPTVHYKPSSPLPPPRSAPSSPAPSSSRSSRSSSTSSTSVFSSSEAEVEFFSTYREIFKEASRLGQAIGVRKTSIPSPLEVIYQQILEIGKRAAQNESFGENVLDEYEFCLSLLNILGERVGEEDWDLVRGLRERFEKMSEAAREGRD